MTFAELPLFFAELSFFGRNIPSRKKRCKDMIYKGMVPETGIEPVRPLSGKRRILSPKINTVKSSTCRKIRSATGFLQCPSTPLAALPASAFAELILMTNQGRK